MEIYDEYLQYTSTERSQIRDVTDDLNAVIKRSGYASGWLDAFSRHTTYGLFVGEGGEAGLPKDLIRYSQVMFPQDPRSLIAQNPDYIYPVARQWWEKYEHDCSKNKYLKLGQEDDRANGAEHMRTHLYTTPHVRLPFIDGWMVLGQFQRVHTWDLDGATGEERSGFEEDSRGRTRLLYVCATPNSFVNNGKKVTIIDS